MRVPARARSWWFRWRVYALAALVLIAVWLPGSNQGWYRTDTHLYAAIGHQAWGDALARHSVRPLWDLHAGADPYFNKPPLPFVIHGAFTHALGLAIWTVRLPCLLAAIGIALATIFAVRRLAGWRIAMMTGLVLATTLPFFRFTRAISLDLWQEMFVAIAVAAVVAMVGPSRRSGHVWVLKIAIAGCSLGLALLCKPFVALGVPVLLAIWLVWIGQRRLAAMLVPITLLAIAVATPWHVAMARAHPDFLGIYLGKQVVDRALHGRESGEGAEPVWYYAKEIARAYWPWLATLLLALVHLVRTRASVAWRDRALLVLALLWSGAWLVGMSCFGGKAPRYLLIVWPLLSAPSAWWLVRTTKPAAARAGRQIVNWLGPAAVAAACILAAAGVRVHGPRDSKWDKLLALLDARAGTTLATTPRAHAIAANLVMLGREWPVVERDPARLAPGALYMVDEHEAGTPISGAELVLESEDFRLYRIGARN